MENIEITAGEMLRDARSNGRRKREISTIAKQLCIREEYLEALEQGAYDKIPEVIYILGFARNYAMELGLNPDEVIAKIKKELCLADVDEDKNDEDENNLGAIVCTDEDTLAKIGFWRRIWNFIRRKWLWIAGGLGIILVLVLVLLLVTGGGNDTPTDSEIPVIAGVPRPTYNLAVREEFGTENRDTARIVIQARGESWVKVEDARGNTEFSRVLLAGDIYYVPDDGAYRGTFGNAGAIDIYKDGVLGEAVGADHVRKTVDL